VNRAKIQLLAKDMNYNGIAFYMIGFMWLRIGSSGGLV
jgi:hypothetical protein